MSSDRVQIRVTAFSSSGDGIGRLEDGCVVFVPGGIPGDLIETETLARSKRMARAEIGRVLEPSASRGEARCAHFGSCGGCTWQHVDYAAQLDAKRVNIRDALQRIGGITFDQEIEITESPDPYHYRARARLVETKEGLGYRRRKSRDCIVIMECPILLPAAERAALAWSSEARVEGKAPAGDDSKESDGRPSDEGRSPRKRAEPEWEILAGGGEKALVQRLGKKHSKSGRAAAALASLDLSVLGETIRASAGSFVQGNALLWDALVTEVRSACVEGSDPAPRIVELYAGIGFFTVPLARAGCRGSAFESNKAALKDLRVNLERAGLAKTIEVIAGRVESRKDWPGRFAKADVLLVDPPRTGLDGALRQFIAESGPPRIVYVSCDPATLARDLAALVSAGYALTGVRAFDLFPQTPHVETIVRLQRSA